MKVTIELTKQDCFVVACALSAARDKWNKAERDNAQGGFPDAAAESHQYAMAASDLIRIFNEKAA